MNRADEDFAYLSSRPDTACSDERIANALAEEFATNYRPKPEDELISKAREALGETLLRVVPGCLTGRQATDMNIKRLLFETTAARHGWVKTQA